MKRKASEASILLWDQIQELQYGLAKDWFAGKEYQFYPTRRWRFDFAIWRKMGKPPKIGIEIDGGGWINGRHNTGSGSAKDREKFNYAAKERWLVLKFEPKEVLDGRAIAFIKKVLESE